ncbi:MAG: hypothetical protein JWO67_3274 [Streptosporangiaceae bacterium]|nr:hypothetical protein [Streptosporangiaceae bacterium]
MAGTVPSTFSPRQAAVTLTAPRCAPPDSAVLAAAPTTSWPARHTVPAASGPTCVCVGLTPDGEHSTRLEVKLGSATDPGTPVARLQAEGTALDQDEQADGDEDDQQQDGNDGSGG